MIINVISLEIYFQDVALYSIIDGTHNGFTTSNALYQASVWPVPRAPHATLHRTSRLLPRLMLCKAEVRGPLATSVPWHQALRRRQVPRQRASIGW
jgi:hypothetical protein